LVIRVGKHERIARTLHEEAVKAARWVALP